VSPIEALNLSMADMSRRATTPDLQAAAKQMQKVLSSIKSDIANGNMNPFKMTQFAALRSRFDAMEQGRNTVAYDSLLRHIDRAGARGISRNGTIDVREVHDIHAHQRLIELRGDTRPNAKAARAALIKLREDISAAQEVNTPRKYGAKQVELYEARFARVERILAGKPTSDLDARIRSLQSVEKPRSSSPTDPPAPTRETQKQLRDMLDQVRRLAEPQLEGPTPE
jgi:hypothetical protein